MQVRFSEARADKAVRFFERRLRHTTGRWSGTPFRLDPWQRDEIIRPLFGTERLSAELSEAAGEEVWIRKYRKAYLELPKKTGKSELGAGIALYALHADGEGGPEVFGAAVDKKQAGLIFRVAADMVEMDPGLRRRSTVNRSRLAHHGVIFVPRTRGVYKVMSADAGSNDGINPSCVVLDELHRQPGRELYDLFDQSFAARAQPLFVILTTAGYDEPNNVAWELHNYALNVATGVLDDPYLFVYMRFCSPEETEGSGWESEELWKRVNPALTSFNPAYVDELRRVAAEARQSPAKIVSFKRLYLNVWLPRSSSSQDKLVSIETWDAGAGLRHDPEDLAGRDAWLGLDLASTTDLAALVALFPNEPGSCRHPRCVAAGGDRRCFDLLARFWIPEANFGEQCKTWAKVLKETIAGWVAEGFVTAIPGGVIDDRDVQSVIEDWGRLFTVKGIAKDPWQSKQLGVLLEEEGFTVTDHPQSMGKMAAPTDEFIRLATGERIHHGGNPVLRWMVANAVALVDSSGNKKPDRRRSANKIDGVVATVMAVSLATAPEEDLGVWVMTVGP